MANIARSMCAKCHSTAAAIDVPGTTECPDCGLLGAGHDRVVHLDAYRGAVEALREIDGIASRPTTPAEDHYARSVMIAYKAKAALRANGGR